ncbi:HAD domain-containing protein [Paraburkholderia dipogonis]|uniref:HAD domain-containing protein n=1 Tax=Paraburkholderia dipogonis TaxID=1211383 RepID=UPI0038B9B9F3
MLFLNYGGVLNVGHGLVVDNGAVTLDTGRPSFEFAPYLIDVLEPWPQVRIIVTTSWLRTLGAERTIALVPVELRRRVVGTTLNTPPRLGEIRNGSAKAMTVIRHASKNRLIKWLALDDEAWGVPIEYESYFLRTDSKTAGLAGSTQTAKAVARNLVQAMTADKSFGAAIGHWSLWSNARCRSP